MPSEHKVALLMHDHGIEPHCTESMDVAIERFHAAGWLWKIGTKVKYACHAGDYATVPDHGQGEEWTIGESSTELCLGDQRYPVKDIAYTIDEFAISSPQLSLKMFGKDEIVCVIGCR